MGAKYLVHPGYVDIFKDGHRYVHFITASHLMKLYDVSPHDCVIAPTDNDPKRDHWVKPEGLIDLMPRTDGKYELPTS